jgi:hypothetical protein
MPHGMTTAGVVFSADAIEGLPLATLLHMLGNGFCNHPKNKKTWRCNNNLEKTLSEKTEKYNTHQ